VYKDRINVKNAPYNAVGDGVTDDTAAILAAINAVSSKNEAVYLPAGTYLVSSAITINKSNIIVVGADIIMLINFFFIKSM
jgi:polygalacturonase